MSALTKIFVVLLVICASLQTAATVVFVNRVENYAEAAKVAQAKATDADSRYRAAAADVAAATATAEKVEASAATRIQALQSDVDAARQQIAARDAQLAKAAGDQQTLALQNTQLASGIKASEDAKKQLQDTLADSRKSADELVQRNADLNSHVSDLQNKLDQTTREWRYTQEQLASSQADAKRLANAAKAGGLSVDQIDNTPANQSSRINGVIRGVQNINSIEYATISVGSADGVSKGMQFNVINRDKGEWLGTLTVDKVDQNEAVGRLSLKGPVLGQIQPNRTEVRTQL